MSDEITPAVVAPVEFAPVAAPVVTPVAPVVVAETPVTPVVTETAPVVTPPVEAVVEAPKAEPTSVLGDALKPAETPVPDAAKPVETPKVEGQETNTPEGQSEEPAPPPVYEPFTLPEGFEQDGEKLKTFTDILGSLELDTKADHAKLQEFGQKAIDLYTNEVKSAVDNLNKYYETTWERQKNEWKESFLKDPEIGGNRFQTTVNSALSFIKTHGGTEEQQAEFRTLMNTSGLGNHPVMIRLLAKAGQAMSEGRPLAANKPVSPPKSKVTAMYGKNS